MVWRRCYIYLYYSNFEYLDSLYNLSKASNHWTLGNHDSRNGNLEWYSEFTKRPTYYTHTTEGLTIIVMDGNISHWIVKILISNMK